VSRHANVGAEWKGVVDTPCNRDVAIAFGSYAGMLRIRVLAFTSMPITTIWAVALGVVHCVRVENSRRQMRQARGDPSDAGQELTTASVGVSQSVPKYNWGADWQFRRLSTVATRVVSGLKPTRLYRGSGEGDVGRRVRRI
jgi:hypothetical protein